MMITKYPASLLLLSLLLLKSRLVSCHSVDTALHREREEDGAYVGRGQGHDVQGGEHDSDFDHESILGKFNNIFIIYIYIYIYKEVIYGTYIIYLYIKT